MNYKEFREYGYRSRLSEIECKGASGSINQLGGIAGQQTGIASQAAGQSQDSYSKFQKLLEPLISQQTALATGDRSEALKAAMPTISQLSAGWGGAKQNLLNSMPPGAARDRALADLQTQMSTNIGSAQAGLVQQAPQVLAGVGGQMDQDSLQRLGAALSGFAGGSKTTAEAGQLQAAQQAAMLNFFGSLAGAAGTALGGPLGGKICWVAEAIYGQDDLRTWLVRAYISGPLRKTFTGACVWWIYSVIGRQVAWVARRSSWLRAALKPLFDRALARAQRCSLQTEKGSD